MDAIINASIAHVCYVNQIPFLSLRTITDTPARSGAAVFGKNCELDSKRSAEIVLRMLEDETFWQCGGKT